MYAYFYADIETRNILMDAYELTSVSNIKECDLVVLSANGAISPLFLNTDPMRQRCGLNYNEEEDHKIRKLYTLAKWYKKPVLAFGKCASLVHICNGGKCYDMVDNHFARDHPIYIYTPEEDSKYVGKFELAPGIVIRSIHQHIPDIILSTEASRFNLVAATFVSTLKKKHLPTGQIDSRSLVPSRSKGYYVCDPEIYKWNNNDIYSLCFEFYLTKSNFEFVSRLIMEHSGIKWKEAA